MTADPIASPTLALLYLAQGHLGRARAIVNALLERNPTDGQALVLARRLAARGSARLTCTVQGDHLALQWQGVQADRDTHLIWVFTTPNGEGPRVHVSSRRCTQSFGSVELPLPRALGSVAICIARSDAHEGFIPLAGAEPCSWG